MHDVMNEYGEISKNSSTYNLGILSLEKHIFDTLNLYIDKNNIIKKYNYLYIIKSVFMSVFYEIPEYNIYLESNPGIIRSLLIKIILFMELIILYHASKHRVLSGLIFYKNRYMMSSKIHI